MADRRHWRFIVRDQYGYVIQNAKVNVFQPGTSNAFLGTAYNAASGGSTVTNPFTTNDQGEVQAWFDTAQAVDVQVDDNTDAAYRAVDGSGSPVSFTTFTETDTIFASPDFGESGDLVAAIVNPFTAVTAVAGSTGELADAGHTHPYAALTPGFALRPHSAASAGDDLEPARDDHVHPFPASTGLSSKWTTTSNTSEQTIGTLGLSVPANSVISGSMFNVKMYGYQTNGTTACTYTFRVRWGNAGPIIGQALAIVGTTTAHTDNPVQLNWLGTVQTIGATGTATGSWFGSECISTATANTPKLVLDVQNAAQTIDTTGAVSLQITVQMSTTTGTPNLEVDNLWIGQVG